ncbi:MAG TPA: transglycosylase domain-containing protein [Microbacteriaceae bacterium]|nr:transglycosylase domain-containing protein [Microbacteriaceae bacterium]
MAANRTTPGGASGGLLAFIGMSAIAGVLVTAAITPAVAITSLVAGNAVTVFENLPGYLDVNAIPQKSTIWATQTDGTPVALASFYAENREALPGDQISQFAKDAAVDGEDPRFFQHGGVDLQGTLRAVLSNFIGGDVQGGSSITQQFVKNVLITQGVAAAKTEEERQAAYDAATASSGTDGLQRKLKEMRYAIAIEQKFSKDDILNGYLNIAYFGGQVYGIQAASQYYYGINAKDLTLEQAASLLAIVNNPEKFRLDYPASEKNGAENGYAANKSRRDYILDQMLKHGSITRDQHEAAIAAPIAPAIHEPSTGCATAGNAAYFCDYVTWIIKNDFDDPNTADVNEGAELLRTGGLNIYTTLDIDVQNAAASAVAANVPFTDSRFDVGSSAVSVQVGTGRILAMAQNKNYSQDPEVTNADPTYSSINFSTDFNYGGSTGFQPGSTYKVFTLGDWLAEGHGLLEGFNGSPRDFTTFKDSCNGGVFNLPAPYNPKNDDSTTANNAVRATQYSVNTAFVAMASQLDLCNIKKVAEGFGIHRADNAPLQMNPSDVLGTQEVAPLTMAAAYAGIANNGLFCTPVAIDKIQDRTGAELNAPKTKCNQAVSPDVAVAMQYAMAQTFGGTAAASRLPDGIAMIGKTGTTDGAKDTWMNGASSKVATAVWVGNVTGFQNLRSLRFDSGQAATARHRIFPAIMSVANAKFGGDPFQSPDPKFMTVVNANIPNVTGMSVEAAKATLEAAGFVYVDGGPEDSKLPAGQVTRTDPSGQAPKGTEIRVFTSQGNLVEVPDLTGMTKQAATTALNQIGVTPRWTTTTQPRPTGTTDQIVVRQSKIGAVTKGSIVSVQLTQ